MLGNFPASRVVERRVAQRFGVDRLGFGGNGAGEIFRMVGIDKEGVYAEFAEIDVELGVGAAVERAPRQFRRRPLSSCRRRQCAMAAVESVAVLSGRPTKRRGDGPGACESFR